MKYIIKDFSIYAGKNEIARAYAGKKGYEVKILQGMNREATVHKIIEDCPGFAAENNLTVDTIPKLFTK